MGSTGGGNAIVCRDSASGVKFATLLDLYEGQLLYGMNIPSLKDGNSALRLSINKSPDEYYVQDITNEINDVVSRINVLPKGVVLKPSDDLGHDQPVVYPVGCALEGVGFYDSKGQLRVVSEILKAFDGTSRAAFFYHEALYKVARERAGSKTSERVRYFIGTLFSSNVDFEQIKSELFKLTEENSPFTYYVVRPDGPYSISVSVDPPDSEKYSVEAFCLDNGRWGGKGTTIGSTQKSVGHQEMTLSQINCRGTIVVNISPYSAPGKHYGIGIDIAGKKLVSDPKSTSQELDVELIEKASLVPLPVF